MKMKRKSVCFSKDGSRNAVSESREEDDYRVEAMLHKE